MPLTVLNVAYPLAPVGPDAVGGAEQILSHLDAALVRSGHRSLVLAAEGSRTYGELLSTLAVGGELTDAVRRQAQRRHRETLQRALAEYAVDVVHLHGLDFVEYLPRPDVPVIVTLHLPPGWYRPDVFHLTRPKTEFVCVSDSQRRACPHSEVPIRVIENGIPLESFPLRRSKRPFALALGRICPEKGFHIALSAAERAGMRLLIGGQVFEYETHRRYFDEQIAARLNGRLRFLGPLGLERKRRLLAAARCVLIPSLCPETSSLVAMEALACGTPVIAFPAGALTEIVADGRTGFLVQDEAEMAAAIAAVDSIDPDVCRAAVRNRFSAERMCGRYLDCYHRARSSVSTAERERLPVPIQEDSRLNA